MIASRRGLLAGMIGFVACSPAIVRASSLMALPQRQSMFPDFDPAKHVISGMDSAVYGIITLDGWDMYGERFKQVRYMNEKEWRDFGVRSGGAVPWQ